MDIEHDKFLYSKGPLHNGYIPIEKWILYTMQIGVIIGADITKIDFDYLRECYNCGVTCLNMWDKEEDL